MKKKKALSACVLGSMVCITAAAQNPNIVILMADQWRGGALGCQGVEPVITPNLDQLVAQGILCTQATSAHPVSSPARASFMTGLYPNAHNVKSNCNSRTAPFGVELQTDDNCWSDILATKGYSLGYIGKWHLDSPHQPYVNTSNNRGKIAWNEWCPPDRRHGFSYWMAYGTYDKHLRPMYWDTQSNRDDFFYVDKWGPEYEADCAIDYICNKSGQREPDKPFVLMVSMNPPHTEYNLVPEKYKAIYEDLDVDRLAARFPNIPPAGTPMGDLFRKATRDYYACMTGVDEQIGRILDCIKNCGLDENTIVVFVSDHGNCVGMNGEKTKDNPYEPSFTIPLIFKYGNNLKPGTYTFPIDLVDIYPTIFGLMNHSEWIDPQIHGQDLSACLRGDLHRAPSSRPFLIYDHKQPIEKGFGKRGIRTLRYTYVLTIENCKVTKGILFDRKTDPFQLENIYNSVSRKKLMLLHSELITTLNRIGDPISDQL